MAIRVQRRINHTGRTRIPQSDVQIILQTQPDGLQRFSGTLTLDGKGLPESGLVFIEAWFRDTMQRFPCGTVGALRLPGDTAITEIETAGQIEFRIKVIDPTPGSKRVLAMADGIYPKGDEEVGDERDSLISTMTRDLGNVPWVVEFRDEDKPVLVLNSRIPGVKGRIRQDVMLQTFILPAVVAEVLTWIAWNQEVPDDSWQERWLKFCEKLAGEPIPEDKSEADQWKDWIDCVASRFAERYHLCDRYLEVQREVLP